MKWLFYILGALLVLVGGFWFMQGINVIPIGMMAGQAQFAILGGVMVLLGVGLILAGSRRAKKPAPGPGGRGRSGIA
jgi:hypothetical protein